MQLVSWRRFVQANHPMFQLVRHDPILPTGSEVSASTARDVLALDIQTKYQFLDDMGAVFHEYALPASPEIQNCGGYVDKIAKYRDPALIDHLRQRGVSKESFASTSFQSWPRARRSWTCCFFSLSASFGGANPACASAFSTMAVLLPSTSTCSMPCLRPRAKDERETC